MDAVEVLAAKKYLRAIGEWPSAEKIDAKKWLDRFAPEHVNYAVALLDAFIFISDRQVTKLFVNTIHSMSEEISRAGLTYQDKRDLWMNFLGTAIFSAPTGEEPNPSDSGHIFQRLARTEIGISEDRIVLDSGLRAEIEEFGPAPLVFVDDFAGSGNQFLETWRRPSWQGHPSSISELVDLYNLDVYYAPLICTAYAVENIQNEAPAVQIRTSHLLTDVYCATNPNTVVFPEDLRSGVAQFIEEASRNAGIETDKDGFHHLALDLAFEHSIPDACIAILWSKEGGWVPLMEKK